MKKILFVAGAFVVALLFAFRHADNKRTYHKATSYIPDREKRVVRCSPDWNELKDWLEEYEIPPIPGAGNYKWKISTGSDSAQFYFNQGINMYYGFHIIEAMASFKKAASFDPSCAMLFWAQALAYGPNINDYGYAASPSALEALEKAKQYAGNATEFEKALIGAMAVRYVADSADATRKKLNSDYTEMMKKVSIRFPGEADAGVLYADAMMLEHPWDLWNVNGTPKPWTPAIRSQLEKMLARSPGHPGANHYYIHVMEPSPFADKALPSASRLGLSNPGLSHLVHMPSHIYLRTGRYQLGVDVNTKAVNSYRKTIPLYAPVTGADFLYIIHNLHMKTNNAMLAGNYAVSINSALETNENIPGGYADIPAPLGNYVQYIHSTPILVYIRFGKWDEILKQNAPDPKYVFSSVIYHFGKGMAYAGQQKIAEARNELVALQGFMKDSSLLIPYFPFSPLIESAKVAEQLLEGTISLKENKLPPAIAAFEKAALTELNMVYNEPRDWLLNPKHYLGNAWLKAGNGKEAKVVFERDLKNNNENGWALFGLWQALLKEKKTKEAAAVLLRFRKAFANADTRLTDAIF